MTDYPELTSKRILILFPHMVVPGGALNYVLKLAEFLVQKGSTVGIVTMRHDAVAFPVPEGVEILSVDGPLTSSMAYWCFFPFWQKKIERRIDQWRPDILLPQVFPSNWWGWLFRRNHQAPLLWICHEPSAFIHSDAWIAALKPRWKSLLAGMLRPALSHLDRSLSVNSDMVAANSRFTASAVERVYGLHCAAVAYPTVDASFFTPGNGERDEAVITVAALSKFKRVDFLLRVFARVVQSQPQLVYHVVGTGDEAGSLHALAASLGIADKVVFQGAVNQQQLRDLYRRSLLFLHGGIDEPFGMAPLEGIACGTPVIAHNSGGPTEYISDSCGRLVNGTGEEEWAEAVTSFLRMLRTNPEYYGTVPENACRFSWPDNFNGLNHLLADLLHEGSVAGETQSN